MWRACFITYMLLQIFLAFLCTVIWFLINEQYFHVIQSFPTVCSGIFGSSILLTHIAKLYHRCFYTRITIYFSHDFFNSKIVSGQVASGLNHPLQVSNISQGAIWVSFQMPNYGWWGKKLLIVRISLSCTRSSNSVSWQRSPFKYIFLRRK